MKQLARKLLADVVVSHRNAKKMTQAQLAEQTGINRTLISRLEAQDYVPSVDQLLALSEVLAFEPASLFVDPEATASIPLERQYKIAVAGTGYVGLSLAVLLSQHNQVTAVDIVPEKVEKLNNYISPIQDEYIEKYLAEAKEGSRTLHLTATLDGAAAYADADYIIVAAPTNYDPKQNFFDCSAVESVLALIKETTAKRTVKPTVVIKSTIPVGYTVSIREKMGMDNIIFSPEFLRESKALYDNLYPSRIIVSCDKDTEAAARVFAGLLQQGAIKSPVETLFMGYTEAEATKLFVNT
ncbi:MAG: helix-turn-helix domain-containing protein, partial [Firmicutes bacterium]|nr:helix-turn-helix domain-containing protein [Bacillota bacterium]